MKLYPSISDDLALWAQHQPVFFTASAPTHAPHINVSPKGQSSSHFRILSPNLCAYIDRTGSGCETISHSYENGRLCILFTSFGDTPRILRLFCRSEVVEWDDPGFEAWVGRVMGEKAKGENGKVKVPEGARAVVVGEIWEVQTSCGYGVPRVKKGLYAPQNADGKALPLATSVEKLLRQGTNSNDKTPKLDELSVFEERPSMDQWADSMTSKNALLKYQREKNSSSIDGLPGLRAARRDAGERILWFGDARARLRRAASERDGTVLGFVIALVVLSLCTKLGVQL